jgi:methyl-accepting chemotaxis protein
MRPTFLKSRGVLSLALAAAMLTVAFSGVVDYWEMARLDRVTTSVRHGDAALATAAEDMREDLLELRRYEKDVFINIGSPADVRQYKAKWDRAFIGLRYDLSQAHRASPVAGDAPLQQVIAQMADYRMAFTRIYDSIMDGQIRTTQQANEAMSPFKDSVHIAESKLAEIGGYDRDLGTMLGPAVVAQRWGMAASALLFLALAALFTGSLRREAPVSCP